MQNEVEEEQSPVRMTEISRAAQLALGEGWQEEWEGDTNQQQNTGWTWSDGWKCYENKTPTHGMFVLLGAVGGIE